MADDGRIRMTHDAEQARAVLSEVSVMLGQYYRQLLGAGFTEPQAFTLVAQAQAMLMSARAK